MNHDSVLDGPSAGGIVAGHAADRRDVGGGYVDGEVPTGRLELLVEPIQHDAWLHSRGAALQIDFEQPVHVATGIHDHGLVHGLARLRAAGAPGKHGDSLFARDRNGSLDVFDVPRQGHPDGLDLVDGGVRGVPAAAERVEENFSAQGSLQTVGEGGVADPVSHRLTSNDASPLECRAIRSRLTAPDATWRPGGSERDSP